MAGNSRYSYKNGSLKAKLIIIPIVIVVLIFTGILVYLAVKANEDDAIAARKYEFNQYFPKTFDSILSVPADEDYDSDGLSNSDEIVHKTSIFTSDSDRDGLSDADELKFGTDPLNYDCDADGIPDGIEIMAELDPLSPITDGMTKDAETTFHRVIQFREGRFILSGKANIYGATVDQLSLNAVASNAGAISLPYELYCGDEGFDSAMVIFNYDIGLLNASGVKPEDLRVYRFNPYQKDYTPIGAVELDTASGTVTARVPENGVYVLGAKNVQKIEVSENQQMNVYLLIDNSGSMYPKSVQSTSKENDVHFKRLTFASRFVNELPTSAKVGISAFTYEYKNLCSFTDDKQSIIDAINSIRTMGAGFDGTSVERALMMALESFTGSMVTDKNVIILLTDGISTSTGGYTVDNITAVAKQKNVTIMTISLGDEFDGELLQSIADRTGGRYFPISEANILEGLYSTMIASMKDDIVDDDYDGTPDSYTLYDTGFIADTNGYSFTNFKSKSSTTVDFGMVMLARDWFKNNVHFSYSGPDANLSYTFEGTTLNTAEPLRKVILGSMQSPWMKPDSYLDFTKKGGTLYPTKAQEDAAQDAGFNVVTLEYGASDTWSNMNILYPDHTNSNLRTKYSENDYQLIRAILLYNSLRTLDPDITLNTENDLNKVKSILSTGSPVVTEVKWEENGVSLSRFVLLTTLRRDLENPNIFKIKIYDVNTDSPVTVVINRTLKYTDTSDRDFSYSAIWNGKVASLSFYTKTIEQVNSVTE